MAATRYVALLRGINVGGKNKVGMADLRDAFADAGFKGARTYIASGNVLFRTERPATMLEDEIEAALKERFRIPLVVVVRTHRQLGAVVNQAPADFAALHGTPPRRRVPEVAAHAGEGAAGGATA